ncbi:hypothetical protein TUBRATIS_18570 [Tubulinosema ratisbonensis]|uniref:Uncharacterized protein n=1 Tax=Tubulinosema ratisbonensis TaxID=291195 RepID=A0A437AKQ5_9MICR|nr:hypothetical protein TUBRATIS_18570 [Tubulinosema ratisbonensis]
MAYYNARYLTIYTKLSPGLIIYLTHSFVSLFLIYDLLKYKKNFFSVISKRIGIPFKKFLFLVFFLSLFHNLKSFIRFFCFIKLNDCTVISLSCINVLFTKYLFSRVIMNHKEKIILCFISLSVLVIIFTEKSIVSSLGMLLTSFFSSLYNVLYKRLVVETENLDTKIESLLEKKKEILKGKERKKLRNFYKKRISSNNLLEENTSKSEIISNSFSDQSLLETEENLIEIENFSEFTENKEILNFEPFDRKTHEMNNPNEISNFFKKETKTKDKKTYFVTYYFIIFSGLITLLFYWPILFFDFECEITWRGAFHCTLGICLSQLIIFFHFALIGFFTPVFAQLSNVFFKLSIFTFNILFSGIQFGKFASFLVILCIFTIDKFETPCLD